MHYTNHLSKYLFLVIACVFIGCDNGPLEEFELESKSAANSATCGLGTHPAIYDSFNYSNTSTTSIGTAGTIFGENAWEICNGSSIDTEDTRMWYRYNQDDTSLNPDGHILYQSPGSQWAKLILRQDAGYTPSDNFHHPAIRSGARLDEGTYAARVKFSDLEPGTRQMQSFWLYTAQQYPGYNNNSLWREYDLEWNNWMESNSQKKMTVTNHLQGNRNQNHLDCLYYSGGNYDGYSSCNTGSSSYLDGSLSPGRYENEWVNLYMVVDYAQSKVSYSLQADGYGGVSGALWGGDHYAYHFFWGVPQVVYGNIPGDYSLNVNLSLNWRNDGKFFSDSRPDVGGSTNWQHEMQIDYFYYSPVKYLTHSQVINEVVFFQTNGHSRVNTTGETLHK